MYLYPRFRFPPRFMEEAGRMGKSPDELYALRLLESTGICTVPGTGFGQVEGTYHMRVTFLVPETLFPAFMAALAQFHAQIMQQYK